MANPEYYKYDRQGLTAFVYTSIDLNENLATSFQKSSALFERLVDTDLWQGRSKDEFTSFFHLVMQYHGWVAGQEVKSVGNYVSSVPSNSNGNDCCERMRKVFSDLFVKMNGFNWNSEIYKKLEAISE